MSAYVIAMNALLYIIYMAYMHICMQAHKCGGNIQAFIEERYTHSDHYNNR